MYLLLILYVYIFKTDIELSTITRLAASFQIGDFVDIEKSETNSQIEATSIKICFTTSKDQLGFPVDQHFTTFLKEFLGERIIYNKLSIQILTLII